MKKKLLMMTTLLSTIPLLSFAAENSVNKVKEDVKQSIDGVTVKIGGSFKPQYGSVHSVSEFKYLDVGNKDSKKIKNDALVNETKLWVDIEANNIPDIQYGGQIKLNVDRSYNTPGDKMMLFLQGAAGRFEIGSYNGIENRIRVAPSLFARATGGIDGDYMNWVAKGAYNTNTNTKADLTGLYYTSVLLPSSTETGANRISYYTPSFKGLTFGVSYVPDTEVKGRIITIRDDSHKPFVIEKGMGFKNVMEAGLRYETQFADDVVLSFSAMGEVGQAKKKDFTAGTNKVALTRHSLNAFELGSRLDYKGLSVGASYALLGKSGGIKKVEETPTASGSTTTDKTSDFLKAGKNPKGDFWTLGAAYEFEDIGVSATYYNSRNFGAPIVSEDQTQGNSGNSILSTVGANGSFNKFNALSFGVDYKIVPGMLAYAEYTSFKFSMDDTFLKSNEGKDIKLNKGHVILTGMKFEF